MTTKFASGSPQDTLLDSITAELDALQAAMNEARELIEQAKAAPSVLAWMGASALLEMGGVRAKFEQKVLEPLENMQMTPPGVAGPRTHERVRLTRRRRK